MRHWCKKLRRHAVTLAVLGTTAAASAMVALPTAAQASVQPMSASPILQPKISPCGGASVTVNWNSQDIYISGQLRDECGAGTYTQLFLTFTGDVYNNRNVGTAGPGSHVNVAWGTASDNPSYISVTVCEHDNGWHCGYKVPTVIRPLYSRGAGQLTVQVPADPAEPNLK